VLDIGGFYSRLLAFMDHMVAEGFVSEANRKLVVRATSAAELLDKLATWQPLQTTKWSSGVGTDSR